MRRVAWYQKRVQLNLAQRAWQVIQGFKEPEEYRNAHCLTSKSHDVTPVLLLLKRRKENGGHIMIQNIKMAAILLYKTMKGGKKPINNPFLTLAMLVYQKKILRRFRPMLGNRGYFSFESGILGFGIRITVQGIRNPTSDRDLESRFQCQRIRNPTKLFPHAETFFVPWIMHSCWPRGWKWLLIYLTCVTEYDL